MENYIILGIIQGIFEWIPISSEGVLTLIGQFLLNDFNFVDLALFLHLGTMFSILVYFRKDWKDVLTLKTPKLFRFLLISTPISLIIGYLFYKLIRNLAVGNNLLLIVGFGLILTSYFQMRKIKIEIGLDKLAILSGFLQGLSVIPGLSRSGSTIFGLSFGKFKASEVLKLSYMMSVPIVLVSSAYLFLNSPNLILQAWPCIIISFLVGLLGLHFLMILVKRINFANFTLLFGLLCIIGSLIIFIF